MSLNENTRKQISDLLAAEPVVLFMKGSRQMPQCGFSAQVVQILDGLLPSYETVDVLGAPDLRDAIKQFSDWPTIPQLYVDGKFIGGCDIVRELHASGELQKLLDVPIPQAKTPAISISDAAATAFKQALADAGTDVLRLQVSAAFEHDLYFGPRAKGDIEIQAGGLTLVIDPSSARRADGIKIDFVDGATGGFRVTNPNEPVRVGQLTAPELKARLDRGEIILFDVRPDAERALAKIDAAKSLDGSGQEYLFSLEPNTPIAVHCHHGSRSQQAAQQLLKDGFRKVFNLVGGIDAWSQLVDPKVPRY